MVPNYDKGLWIRNAAVLVTVPPNGSSTRDIQTLGSTETKRLPAFAMVGLVRLLPQRVLSTCIVESRVSIIGITIMVWVSEPHIGT